MCGFRALRAVGNENAQRMSPNERMQEVHIGFREGNRIVHALNYAMQIAFPGFDSIRFMECKNLVGLAMLAMATGYAQAQQQAAQQPALHLNPAVEKLAHGQPIIGTQTDDMSLQNCHALARQDVDYSYVVMEHGPLNLDGLAFCIAAMAD